MNIRAREVHATSACSGCPVREASLCRGADLALLETLRVGERILSPGMDLAFQGVNCANIYVVLDGWVCLYELMEDGRRQILQFALPGDVVGFRGDGEPLTYSAQSLTAVAACVIPWGRFLKAAHRNPELALRLSGLMARDGAMAYVHLTSVGRRTALERVAYLLLELFYRARTRFPVTRGDSIALPLTQSHIGDALGLTPVHTNRMLRELREAGIIELSQRTLRVINPDRLASAAGFEQDAGLPWLRPV